MNPLLIVLLIITVDYPISLLGLVPNTMGRCGDGVYTVMGVGGRGFHPL